jgi:carbon-monoxide dehydrogenase large subunit
MSRHGIGQPVRRVEDQRFLTGRSRYVDDMQLAHQAYGVVLMSPHAHARIRTIDTKAAREAPGVLLVLTGEDAKAEKLGGVPPAFMPEDMGGPKGYRTSRPLLAADKVRHVGERVAFVVAETIDQARSAAELIEIDYEPLRAVVNVEDAVQDGAPRIWEEWSSNVAFPLMLGNKEVTDAAFSIAKHVVNVRLENNRLSANAIEPRVAIGEYVDEGYTLYTSTQNPHGVRHVLAQRVFGVPETRIRVVSPDVGGGFGMKGDIYPEEGLVLWAARRLGRPVKWTPSRTESMLGDDHGRDQLVKGEMALDENGKILAIRAQALHAVGAYLTNAAVVPVLYSLKLIPNVYAVPAVHVATRAVFTNTTPLGPYRGAGRPEAVYLTERLIEAAAKKTGINAIELRRRNYIQNMPHAIPTGLTYDSGEFGRLTDRCIEISDWPGFAERKKATEERGRLRGRSLIYYIEDCGVFNERMELRFDPSGMVTIVAGTFSHGQGHATTYAQMVAQWLGVPFESIRFVQGDTDQVPFGRGTYASRSVMLGGAALKMAAESIIEKARPLAAHLLEAAGTDLVFKEGRFEIIGTDRKIPLTEVAKAFYRPVGLPKQFGVGLDASGHANTEPPNFPNGCHVCEVVVDPETGAVDVDRYAVVDDVGVTINPLICAGQIHGALAQGIGQALFENVAFDRESGQMLSASFMDYQMPRATDFPDFALDFVEVPCRTNPLGVKGVGEAGCVGAPPAVILAILDALRPLGVEHLDMPATPHRVWKAIQQNVFPANATACSRDD